MEFNLPISATTQFQNDNILKREQVKGDKLWQLKENRTIIKCFAFANNIVLLAKSRKDDKFSIEIIYMREKLRPQ